MVNKFKKKLTYLVDYIDSEQTENIQYMEYLKKENNIPIWNSL